MKSKINLALLILALTLAACATATQIPPAPTLILSMYPTEVSSVTAPEALATPVATATVEATSIPNFTVDSLNLSPDLTAALKKHSGLEVSITAEAGGKFSVNATVFSSESQQPTSGKLEVVPSTMVENLTTTNKYGNTPVMQTEDGKKLYWVDEEKAWFEVEISPDIAKPVFIPFNQREVATRVIIAEYPEPFSQAALDRWKTAAGINMVFQYLNVSAVSGTSTRFGYLENQSVTQQSLDTGNSPVQKIDAWFVTSLPDGTPFEYFPTKWLDPTDAKNPDPNDWKIINCASGQEIMGIDQNRTKFDALWVQADSEKSKMEIVPIFKTQEGFFDSTNNLLTFGAAQPSLQKLLDISDNTMDNLPNPGFDNTPYKNTFDYHFPNLSQTNQNINVGISKDDPKYHGFFPSDIQLILFPSMIISH